MASISTPVSAFVVAVDSIRAPLSIISMETSKCVSASGWHSGINSDVFFPALNPRDTSDFERVPLRSCLFFFIGAGPSPPTFQLMPQRAQRAPSQLLPVTSTMRARPSLSTWVNSLFLEATFTPSEGTEHPRGLQRSVTLWMTISAFARDRPTRSDDPFHGAVRIRYFPFSKRTSAGNKDAR